METKKEWYSRGYLPHRDKISLLQSITFRLADSLPKNKLEKLELELLNIPKAKQDLEKRKRIEDWLDSGIGCCALKHPEMAKVMQDALFFFDGKKYKLMAWCIMPNHVHILVEPYIEICKIVQSWKAFTGKWALQNNEKLGFGIPVYAEENRAKLIIPRKRVFWMREYWDRYIRNEEHFNNVINYFHNNPVKAKLCKRKEDWKWSSFRYIAEQSSAFPEEEAEQSSAFPEENN